MLLGSSKTDLDRLLGKPVMARRIFGLPGEKAWAYRNGDFRIVVGFIGGLARYLAVIREKGPKTSFSPGELAGALALNAPSSLWEIEVPEAPPKPRSGSKPPRRQSATTPAPTSYFRLIQNAPRKKGVVENEIHGWMPGHGGYAFFYLPELAGQVPLLASEWGVHQALG